ncbi:hypothetical protein [Brachybacterium tyrofermentans]|uniref:hypothetical protein n=1 Tax=Brachybacterium tyrofermentans TaxID=47848 RepID=UPI003FD63220
MPSKPSTFSVASLRTTASHTIGIPHLVDLLAQLPAGATLEDYQAAVVDENILSRPTHAGRLRTFRHLREIYLLDPTASAFAALRRVWDLDMDARPLLAGTLALTRDVMFRDSLPAITRALPGAVVTSDDVSEVVAGKHATGVSASTLGKVGRNVASCWTQTGHLAGRSKKVRTLVEARPSAVAYSAYLGHLSGKRGLGVLDTEWSRALDLPEGSELKALQAAHQAGFLRVKSAGSVVEVGFDLLSGSAR